MEDGSTAGARLFRAWRSGRHERRLVYCTDLHFTVIDFGELREGERVRAKPLALPSLPCFHWPQSHRVCLPTLALSLSPSLCRSLARSLPRPPALPSLTLTLALTSCFTPCHLSHFLIAITTTTLHSPHLSCSPSRHGLSNTQFLSACAQPSSTLPQRASATPSAIKPHSCRHNPHRAASATCLLQSSPWHSNYSLPVPRDTLCRQVELPLQVQPASTAPLTILHIVASRRFSAASRNIRWANPGRL